MSAELRQALDQVARRFRLVRLFSALALCWTAWAVAGLAVVAVANRPAGVGLLDGRFLLGALASAFGTALACAAWAVRSARDRRWVARRIEARHPELNAGLLAAVEVDAAPDGRLGFLQTAVVRSALVHHRTHDWTDTVPDWRLVGSQTAHLFALLLLAGVSLSLIDQSRATADQRALAALGAGPSEVTVEPGDTAVERGSTLLVVARFDGGVPAEANLVVDDGAPTGPAGRTMARSLEDPTFAGRVEAVADDLTYHVAFEGRSSPSYRVKVFEYPELRRADARLKFPAYTALGARTVEDVRHVTAVEGTELTLLCRLNKDVKIAQLVDEKGAATPLALDPKVQGGHVYAATLPLADTHRYKVQLVDRDGRTNKLPTEVVVNVTRNQPPTIKITQPARDVRVSAVEELGVKAQIADDFGVVRHGLSYAIAGAEPAEIVLNPTAPASKKVSAEHLLDFEALKAVPDQLVTYFFWADDVGPDGQPRRTSGDMFFAEVRHFEEIFRQGEPPPGGESQGEGQQGNAREAEKLADLQKEIVNGTWKVIRRETGAKRSPEFAADTKTLAESQHAALEQAKALGEQLNDEQSKANLARATAAMNQAETRLSTASTSASVPTLSQALASEQAAYQALLKLRAREFQVVRNNSRSQRSGGASGGSPSQQQLNQLELSNDENRFEDQRTARARQEQLSQREREQREDRQVTSRLKELAQRQSDLNERLKELQSALEAAKEAKARDEIERQLKRLRDQQQQLLRDTDELRERMENDQNRERMADARQQLEQTRERVRQTSEALEQGRVPQAVTESARAGRELNDLREEMRKNASNRFAEDMTDMRGQARKLDDEQKALTEKLDAWKDRPQRSLRDTGERQKIREGLQRERKDLDQLLDRMRNTVQEAEETEPLLAKELFDTVRKANEKSLPDALKAAEQLTDAGIAEEAAKSSREASEGIQQVREGVERAARSVLGDEAAALRRAQAELDDLADQVNREIARATGQDPNADGRRPRGESRDGQQGQQKGQQKGQQGQQGQQGQPKGQQGQQGQQGGQPGQQKGQQGQQGGQPGQRKGQQGQGGQGPLRGGAMPREGQPGGGGGGGGGPENGLDRVIEGLTTGPGGPGAPIAGEGYRQWADRMRDVEELLQDPGLRSEAARIRDRVRGARDDLKRHSKLPDWNKLQGLVAEPIRELRDRVAEEVRKRESPDALVPIDRDPVPPQYAEGVRRYYERLGSGR